MALPHTHVEDPRAAPRRAPGHRGGGRVRPTKTPAARRLRAAVARVSASSESPVVYVVDDDASIRASVRFLLESVDLAVQAFDSPSTFLARYTPGAPGCLILDLRFPETSGFDLLERKLGSGIDLPVLVLTAYATVPLAVRAMKAKALEVIEKPYGEHTILEAVQKAFAVDRRRRRQRAKEQDARERRACLSPRQRQVARHIVAGRTTKEIADLLSLSTKTVEVHRKLVMRKTGVRSVVDLGRLWDLARMCARRERRRRRV